ncbi:hypothetical protein EMCG_03751 [[Emmonsia] crescens]|uniref:Uncharacterized protein n=1 Tax=[Emmonsia] crescens TaxID=73230 RepID=A0A0G2HU67_9EURO|nr:hypothetical protein EMCG_03751 [Emmonsia crescens UAMH 3008]
MAATSAEISSGDNSGVLSVFGLYWRHKLPTIISAPHAYSAGPRITTSDTSPGYTISTDQSDFDRRRICLIILFMKLQSIDDALVGWNVQCDEYKAIEVDRDLEMGAVQGIDEETLVEIQEEECWTARSEEIPNEWEEEEEEEESLSPLQLLLYRIPVDALRGNLGRMRFARQIMQGCLEALAPNYRMW